MGDQVRIFYYGIRKTGKNDYNIAYVFCFQFLNNVELSPI